MINRILSSRREFLSASRAAVAGTGGLLIGCKVKSSRLSEFTKGGEEIEFNAWIHISEDDRIIFILDRSEMGQGVATTHTMMVAEELNTHPDLIEVRNAASDPLVYYHPDFFVQFTGGSSSTASSWRPLREAGARARYKLEFAAAMLWRVPTEECHAEDKFVHHRPGNSGTAQRKISFGALAKRASRLPSTPSIRLKDKKSFRFLGKMQKRRDLEEMVTGSLSYGIDHKVPGMVYAYVIRSPYRNGDPGKLPNGVEKMPGVLDIFAVSMGIAIVATNTWLAIQAGLKFHPRIRWPQPKELANTESLRNAYKEDLKRPGQATSRHMVAVILGKDSTAGDVNVTYETAYLPHSQMEPLSCMAFCRGSSCEVWVGTQFVPGAKQTASIASGLKYEQITVNPVAMGGAFGRRFSHEHVRNAVEISKKMGKPVKVTCTREDEFEYDYYQAMVIAAMTGSVNDNKIVKWRNRLASQSLLKNWVADPNENPGLTPDILFKNSQSENFIHIMQRILAGNWIADPFSVDGAVDVPYADGIITTECHEEVAPIPIGAIRSIGRRANVFFAESFVDELADHAKIDPYEFRLNNLASDSGERRILEFTHQLAGPNPGGSSGIFRGYSQARFLAPFLPDERSTYSALIVELSVKDQKLKLHRIVAGVDCGFAVNPDIVRAQIEGGIIFGLSSALKQTIEFIDGIVQQRNFLTCDLLRMDETPQISVHIFPSTEAEPKGVGEVIVPLVAPAVCNAIFQATGKRIRRLPILPELERT